MEADLLVSEGGTFGPTEPFVFQLKEADAEAYLSLSLDGTDVSHFVQRQDEELQLVLPYRVEAGKHELRLMTPGAEGDLEELGAWTVQVVPGPWLESAEVRAELSGEWHRRFADEDLEKPVPSRDLATGAMTLTGEAAGPDWDAALRFPALYRSDRLTQSGQPWDLADAWVRLRRGRARAEAGYLSPGPSSLVMEGFHRRGVAGRIDLDENGSQLTAFSVRANPISGFEEGIGLSDRDNRVNGAMISGTPWVGEQGSLFVSGTYLRGRTSTGGSGIGDGFGGGQSGTAWSVVADGELGGERIRLRGEYARSRMDRNRGGPGHSGRDDAYSAFLNVRPFSELLVGGAPVDFELTTSLEEVGSQFGSPANLFVQNDFRRSQFGGTLRWLGLDARANYSRTRYNAEGREEDPAFRNDAFETFVRYQMDVEPEGFLAKYIGAPYVEAGWNRNRLKPIATPELGGPLDDTFGEFLPVYADEHQRQGSLRIGAAHQVYDWSVSHTIGRIEDRTRLQPDTRSDLSSLELGWQPNYETRLSLFVQRDRFRLEDTGAGTTTWTAVLGLYRQIIPEKLDLNANVSMTQIHGSTAFQDESDDFGVFGSSGTDERSYSFYGALAWTAIAPKPNRPGVTFTVDGYWERREDDIVHSNTRDSFQTFLKVRIDWPLVWGKGV